MNKVLVLEKEPMEKKKFVLKIQNGSRSRKLVIAEKEQAGERIAQHLGCQPREGYWQKDDYVVVAARGHLLDMWLHGLRVRDINMLPATQIYYRILKQDKKKMGLIQELWNKCDSFIIATDFDREGEVIGANIINHLRRKETLPKDIPRVYFSALTESELSRAFNNMTVMDESLLSQGLARGITDTIIGLNLTKALTILFKHKFEKLTQAISMGRVQSPLLSVICRSVGVDYRKEAESEIDQYNPTQVWLVTDEGEIELPIPEPKEHRVRITTFEKEEEEIEQSEFFPNTSTVQKELPFKPDVTMKICESLYLKGWATYPRTRSRFVPKEEIEKLEQKMKRLGLIPWSYGVEHSQDVRQEAKLPHWAITLTLEGLEALDEGKMKGREEIVAKYLITKMAKAMAPPLEVETTHAHVIVDDEEKRIEWGQTCENIEDAISFEEFKSRPQINEGTYDLKIVKPRREDVSSMWKAFEPKFNVFTEKDLVSWMEKEGLGTEATRHTFPVVLQKRNYIDEANLPNQLGERVAVITDELGLRPNLTSEIETRIEKLETLNELPQFKEWITTITKDLLSQLQSGAGHDIQFNCPKGHPSRLINTRNGLFMFCESCKSFYPL